MQTFSKLRHTQRRSPERPPPYPSPGAAGGVAEDLAAALQGGCGAYFREDDKLYYQASGLLRRAEAAAATGAMCCAFGGRLIGSSASRQGAAAQGAQALRQQTHPLRHTLSVPLPTCHPSLPASFPPCAADREALTREAVALMLRVPLACDLAQVVPQLAYLRVVQAIVDLPLRVGAMHAGTG